MKLIVIVVSMLLAGCATPVAKNFPSPIDYVAMNQVQIDDQFNMIDISLDNIFIELKKCVPLYSDNAEKRIKNDFPQPSNKMLGHGQASSSKVFFIKGKQGVCVHQSAARQPIWPASMIWKTINPQGVPPDVLLNWYKIIAKEIATKGMAKVAYVYNNGNANIVSYWADQENKNTSIIYYSSEFKKEIEWNASNFEIKFFHPTMSGISETKRGSSFQKSVFD